MNVRESPKPGDLLGGINSQGQTIWSLILEVDTLGGVYAGSPLGKDFFMITVIRLSDNWHGTYSLNINRERIALYRDGEKLW